jgi:protein RecA
MKERVVDRDKALDMALGQIEKSYGKGSIMKMGEKGTMKVEAISTGSLAVDLALGVGGLPRGRVVEIFGPESSGKSTMAMHVVAEAQRNGGICAYIDAEHAMDPAYAAAIGVDIDELLISQPDTGEQALEIVDMLIRSGALDVVVIDSVAALTPGPRSRARWATATSASRPGSCRRPCASSPPTSTSRTRSASSSTSCGRRSGSCSARRRPRPAGGR